MLDEVNEIIMSNLTRSSIKAKAATATASKAIKTVWKHVYPKQKKSTRMRLNSLNTAFVDLTWVTDVSCFYLRVPQITPVLCQRTKAPVLPSFPCIITTMERKSAVCSYTEAAEETQPFWFSRALSDNLSRSVSLILTFLISIMLITWN